ncbi:hypothetical protein [Bacillus thuringiensis]|uniref:hypothetical protein n=1 Tax=Bacillus thuringiensis TaxID=1428 RepID=UPI000BFDD1B2|nr:hypothetical protein [Bacillus thuringiensis]PGT90005.1 hypothetical protein COD17_09655 [Bacillus thuringiensis]
MKFSTDKRMSLCKGLSYLIKEKEIEIEKIKGRTEGDYGIAKAMLGDKFSLEEVIREDVCRAMHEVSELKELQRNIDDTSNHLLLVPNYIQLQLTGK